MVVVFDTINIAKYTKSLITRMNLFYNN